MTLIQIYEEITNGTITAYHGTDSPNIDNFSYEDANPIKKAKNSLDGFYFTTSKSDALEYGKNLVVVELTFRKLFTGVPEDALAKELGIEPLSWGSSPEDYKRYHAAINKDTTMEYLTSNGYDAVHKRPKDHYIRVDEYIVFDPKQIKIIDFITA